MKFGNASLILCILATIKLSVLTQPIRDDSEDDCPKTFALDSAETPQSGLDDSPTDIRIYSKEIKISKRQPQACFADKNNRSKIIFRLLDEHDVCKDLELQYYVPRRLEIKCDTKYKCNFLEKCRNECEFPTKNTIFNDIFAPPSESSISKYGCDVKPSDCLISDSCNFWYVNIFSEAPEGKETFAVYKCSSSIKEIRAKISVLKGLQETINKEIVFNDMFEDTITLANLNLTFTVITASNNNARFLNKCFLENEFGELAVIEDCNDKLTLVHGKIGEIRCNQKQPKSLNNCTFDAEQISEHHINGNVILCQLNCLDYEAHFDMLKLPRQFGGYKMTQENLNIRVEYDESAVIFGMEGDMRLEQIRVPERCNIQAHDQPKIRGFIENNGASFPVYASTNQHLKITFQCQNNIIISPLLTDKSSEFKQYKVNFNPGTVSLNDVVCNLSCGEDQASIKISGKFENRELDQPDLFNHKIKISHNVDGSSEKSFEFSLSELCSLWAGTTVVIIICGIALLCCCSFSCIENICYFFRKECTQCLQKFQGRPLPPRDYAEN